MNKTPHSATTLFQEMMNSSTEKRSTRDSQKLKALRITTSNEQNRRSSQNTTTKVTNMDGDWQRTRLIDEWMEKKKKKKKKKKKRINTPRLDNNDLQFVSSSSSHYSSSPGFSSSSSSDCESVQQKRNMDSCFPPIQQKQILTSTVHSSVSKQDQIHSYCFVPSKYSKSAAQKIYADIKISKLPISPGGKLTRFFDSLFNGRYGKIKAPNCSSTTAADDFKHKPQMSYPCSSSTRSCLVKKSPAQYSDKSVKKSVRFYPTSIENSVEIRSRNVEHSPSSTYGRKDENLRFSSMDDCRGASEFVVDDTDDTASDTSSELFEIDHIIFAAVSSNSNGSRNNELPVFETTNVNRSNRAISNTETVF